MRAAVVAAAMLLLAGCSGDGDTPAGNGITELPPATVMEKSLAALKTVPSYRVDIHTDNGNLQTSTTIAVVGTDLRGTVTKADGKSEILKVGANYYVAPDEAFWSNWFDQPERAHAYTEYAHGRWIKVAKRDDLIHTSGLDGAFAFAERNALNGAVPRHMSLGERKDVSGVPTITVLDSRNDLTHISVATTGEPYPIRWDFGHGAVADFSGFGTTSAEIEDPAATEVVDMATVIRSS
ncbi:hypothetical protein ACFQS1_35615 [Paractinoplanes rhizophilus]|jgi:hypothetical protein|uniref:Lipoprotein n=1 Tax=Paractinoplanes rhizophilus TaxID=1416877 RepID=A0ABW2I3A2_9ACTN